MRKRTAANQASGDLWSRCANSRISFGTGQHLFCRNRQDIGHVVLSWFRTEALCELSVDEISRLIEGASLAGVAFQAEFLINNHIVDSKAVSAGFESEGFPNG